MTTVDTTRFDQWVVRVLAETKSPVAAEIATNSEEVEQYWPILEKGSRPGRRPWPRPRKKTTRGPGGNIFSKQAVGGFIAKNSKLFVQYLREAYLSRIARTKLPLKRTELASAANEAAARALIVLKKTIPVDSSQAKNSLFLRKAR